jgi:hypothetical protein
VPLRMMNSSMPVRTTVIGAHKRDGGEAARFGIVAPNPAISTTNDSETLAAAIRPKCNRSRQLQPIERRGHRFRPQFDRSDTRAHAIAAATWLISGPANLVEPLRPGGATRFVPKLRSQRRGRVHNPCSRPEPPAVQPQVRRSRSGAAALLTGPLVDSGATVPISGRERHDVPE